MANPSKLVAQSAKNSTTKPVWISGATLHIGDGTVIENGLIGFENGKIVYVGSGNEIRLDINNITFIDGTGKHVYPGFIAIDCFLGLNEIDAARATNDYQEVGDVNPNVRSAIAYNTDSKIIPTYLTNGILTAQVAPTGGAISGTSSVFKLSGWNWEDALYKSDDAIYVNWPSTTIYDAWWAPSAEEQKKNMQANKLAIEQLFEQAAAYAKMSNPKPVNLKLESMRGIFDGKKQVFVRVNQAKGILESVQFFKKFNISPVLVGVEDADLVLDFLMEQKIRVVVDATHRLPDRTGADVFAAYKLPSLLEAKGIPFAITLHESWKTRNLAFQAGSAGAYGLSKEAALSSITLNAAKILAIDSTTGSLAVGKDATLFLADGDALDMQGNRLVYAFIKGETIDLVNHQELLGKKYKTKYGIDN